MANPRGPIELSFRPHFGFKSEGNAVINFTKDQVVIAYYVWSGDVVGEAAQIASAMCDNKLEYRKDLSDYGNGHGQAVFDRKDFRG